ncbi:Alanine valine serine reductase [Hyphodiscus hymeniophilus]|uniref:Alanine valine serine reductase n=1 Tax=Hyphodiscus hymeniophilus TaxID=353542 RepID=A0A9P7AYG5_9HELO|nr:Alanine valine serine reductase [Hyphodiscus hymeniophilus]
MASEDVEMGPYLSMDETGQDKPFLGDDSNAENKLSSTSYSQIENASENALPPMNPFLRFARYSVFGVYRRIFLAVFIINVYYGHHLFTMKRRSKYSPLLVDISTAASANMLVAILIRQDYVINTLFRVCWLVPFATPLRIRRSLAKIYEYGGLHSGAAICSVLWFSILSAILTWEYITIRIADPIIMMCTFTVVGILWAMLITAYPQIRSKRHNRFENVHRYGGWTVLGLFWPELYLFTRALGHQAGPASPGAVLTKLPAFWLLMASCFHVALPWMRLRRLRIQPERLGVGVHAIRLHFSEKVKNCVVYRIADSPLTEWHSFACIPGPNGNGGSLIVSNAGDWTRRAINNPKTYYYTRGVPTVGVLCMAQLFRKVIIVTTGSGIGPCLGTMMNIPATKSRVLWSAPEPRHTFGDEICDKVVEVDPRALVIDTNAVGRKDLVFLAYKLYMEESAEAVFCVSNKALTKHLVYELESRGVPSFGPIWDS